MTPLAYTYMHPSARHLHCLLAASWNRNRNPLKSLWIKASAEVDHMKKGLFWSTPSVALTGLLYFNYSVPAHGLQEYEMGSSSTIFTPLHCGENVLDLKKGSHSAARTAWDIVLYEQFVGAVLVAAASNTFTLIHHPPC